MEDKKLQDYFLNLDIYRDKSLEKFVRLRDIYIKDSQNYIFVQTYIDNFIENIGKLKSLVTNFRMVSLRDEELKEKGNLKGREGLIESIIFLEKEEFATRKNLKKIFKNVKNFEERFPGFVELTEN